MLAGCSTPTTRPGKGPGIPGFVVAALLLSSVDAAKPAYFRMLRREVVMTIVPPPRKVERTPALQAVRASDFEIAKIGNAGPHQVQVHFDKVVFDPAGFCSGEDLF